MDRLFVLRRLRYTGEPDFESNVASAPSRRKAQPEQGGRGDLRSPPGQTKGVSLPGMNTRLAKFAIGQVVRHRVYSFRGVIFDVDPSFTNTEEYWLSIPEHIRPPKDQPFYHLLAENEESAYVAYVSEQNLLADESGQPVGHPQASLIFDSFREGQYTLKPRISH
jgi:heat shock protein HspQ